MRDWLARSPGLMRIGWSAWMMDDRWRASLGSTPCAISAIAWCSLFQDRKGDPRPISEFQTSQLQSILFCSCTTPQSICSPRTLQTDRLRRPKRDMSTMYLVHLHQHLDIPIFWHRPPRLPWAGNFLFGLVSFDLVRLLSSSRA